MIGIELNNLKCKQHYLTIKDLIQNRSRSILKAKRIKRKNRACSLDSNCEAYLKLLLDDSYLERLICCEPSNLGALIDEIVNKHPDFTKVNADSHAIISNVFIDHGYLASGFDKLNFISNIGKDTCLYCNRSYIFCLDKKHKLKPEIDHFYPQSIYPFFGLTYYNLIPSCELCNGINCKGELDPKKEGLKNPYLITSTDFEFGFSITSVSFMNPLSDLSGIKVTLSTNNLIAHDRIFKLGKLYEKHTDHIHELYVKSKLKYTKNFRRYLKSYNGFNFSEEEIDRLIVGNYCEENDLHKRPLSKLYKDVGHQLGLI